MASVTFSTVDRMSLSTSMKIGADDAVLDADVTALKAALDAVLLGSPVRAVVTVPNVVEAGTAVPPNDVNSERERKWLLRIQSSVTSVIYTHEIGTADRSTLPSASSDFLDLSAGVGLALKTAIEDVWESPAGDPGVLLSVQAVGRTG